MARTKLRNLSTKLILAGVGAVVLIWSISYISEMALSSQLPVRVSNAITSVAIVLVAIATVKITEITLSRFEEGIHTPWEEDEDTVASLTSHQREISYRFVQITVYISSLLIIISEVWKIDLSNVLLGAGVLGVLIGLSARQGLSAVISGIIIMGTNVFKVGDWVILEENFGRIEKITFFNTHFRSPQGETHIIPNDNITSNNVTNISRATYRNDLLVSIDYEQNISRAIDVCDDVLANLSKPDSEYEPISGFQQTSVKEFGDSSIVLAVKFWIENPQPVIINQSQTIVFTRIQERFKEEDIAIPYPQMTLSTRDDTHAQVTVTDEE